MKIYAYVALAIAAIGLLWYGVRTVKKANERDAAVAALEAEKKAHSATVEKITADLKASEEQRALLAKGLTAIADRFNSIQIPKVLTRTVEVPGACPRVGVGPDFVSVFNTASDP